MFLPYGLLKTDEALSCKAGVLARHNVHTAGSSKVEGGSRLPTKEEFLSFCHFWLTIFIPSYQSYLNISQAVLPLWIFKMRCKDDSLLQALNPKVGGMITLSTQIKSLVPELFSGWQLFTLQFLIWKSCSTIRFYQSCFDDVEFIPFFQ